MSTDAPFLAAHATGESWGEAAARLVLGLDPVTAAHRLGFVYVTDAFAAELDDIAVFLRRTTGVPHWVGTVGLGVCGAGKEYFGEPAMAALVAPVPDSAFRVFSGVTGDIAPVLEARTGWVDAPPLVVVHADPRNENVPALIARIAAETDGFLVGGLTAARSAFPQLAGPVEEGGLSGVMLSLEAVPVQSGLTQGCSPIGPAHEATSAQENVLIQLDGRPALEVFKEDIGEVLARDLRRVSGYIFAAILVPGSDTGDYMVRNLTGIDPESGAMAIGDTVAPGDRVMFCRRDHDSAVDDMRRMLVDLRDRAGSAPIRGGLYFSCCARGPNQFGGDSAELGLIREELGDFPLAGFFANGEISNNRLYGYTGVLTLFL